MNPFPSRVYKPKPWTFNLRSHLLSVCLSLSVPFVKKRFPTHYTDDKENFYSEKRCCSRVLENPSRSLLSNRACSLEINRPVGLVHRVLTYPVERCSREYIWNLNDRVLNTVKKHLSWCMYFLLSAIAYGRVNTRLYRVSILFRDGEILWFWSYHRIPLHRTLIPDTRDNHFQILDSSRKNPVEDLDNWIDRTNKIFGLKSPVSLFVSFLG